jgi:hypothetical protein
VHYIFAEEPIKTTVAKILNLDDAEIEESKRDLITREIGKFREVMKVMIIFLPLLHVNDCIEIMIRWRWG